MEPMVKIKFKAKAREYKRLNAEGIHQMVSEVLQAQFPLEMTGRAYEASAIWDVPIAAAVERMTIEGACEVLAEAPSPNTVRNVLRGVLPEEGLENLEARLNRLMVARVPGKLRRSYQPCAIDITEIAYHGQHDEDDEDI